MDEPFKRALHYAADRMLDESLALIVLQNTWLHFRPWAAKKLAASEEIQTYLKSDIVALGMLRSEMGMLDMGDGLKLPSRLFGFRTFIPNTPAVSITTVDNGLNIIVRRVVPAAYLYWQPNGSQEAWFMALEYVF